MTLPNAPAHPSRSSPPGSAASGRPPPPWPDAAAGRAAARPARAAPPPFRGLLPDAGTVASASVERRVEGLAEGAARGSTPCARGAPPSTCRSTMPHAVGEAIVLGALAASARSRLSMAGMRSFTTGPRAWWPASSRSRATRFRKFVEVGGGAEQPVVLGGELLLEPLHVRGQVARRAATSTRGAQRPASPGHPPAPGARSSAPPPGREAGMSAEASLFAFRAWRVSCRGRALPRGTRMRHDRLPPAARIAPSQVARRRPGRSVVAVLPPRAGRRRRAPGISRALVRSTSGSRARGPCGSAR